MSWGCINQVQSSLHPKLSMVSIWEVCAGGHKIHCLLPSRIPGDSTDCTSMLWHHSLVCEILFWSLDMRFFAIGTGCEALANNLSNGKEGTLDNPPFRLFQNDQNKKMDSMFYSLWSKMSDWDHKVTKNVFTEVRPDGWFLCELKSFCIAPWWPWK